jgi:hypothetical protein
VAVVDAQQAAVCGRAVAQYIQRRLEIPGRGRRVAALDTVAHHPHSEFRYDRCVVVGCSRPAESAAPELVPEQHVAGRCG